MNIKLSDEQIDKIKDQMQVTATEIRTSINNFNNSLPEGKRLKYDVFATLMSFIIADELLNHHALVNKPIFETFLRHVKKDFDETIDSQSECKCNPHCGKAKIMKVDLNTPEGQETLKNVLSGLSDS